MRRHGWSSVAGVCVAALLLAAAPGAHAQSVTTERQTVTPGQAPAPQPAPAPTTVQVQPTTQAAPAPAPAAPVRETRTVSEQRDQGSFMGTVAKDTLYGALTGVLVGGAIYFIGGRDTAPVNVAYWAAGGALVGAGVGLVEVMVRQSRQEEATAFMDRKASHVIGVGFVPTLLNRRF
jgi:uncharacterized membrane protein